MADGYISQIKLPNEETYDFRDRNLKVYTGSCSTAAGTAIKDVVTDGIFTLEKGAVLFVNFTNTNSAAVGNLKLKINGEADTNAKPIKYLVNGNDPMNIPGAGYLRANQTYMFRYDGTNWVADLNYYTYSNDFANKIGHYNNILARKAIAAESLIVGDETGYEKVASGVTFNLAYPIVWCTGAINANASNYANMFLQHYDRNIATGAKSGFTSTANKVIYLIVTINGNIATIDSNIITDTLPSSDDGKVYISLGKLGAQSTGANYFFLYPVHPMFWYKNGAIREYSGASQYALAAPLSGISGADDLKAIEAIGETTGLLKKTAANTWTLDTSNYVTSSGITSVTIGATSPVQSSTSTAQNGSSASTTISLKDAYGDTKNPYGAKAKNLVLAGPSSGSNAAPSFRALVAADIPSLAYVPATSGANDVNTLVNTGIYNITSGSLTNGPVGYGYGQLLVMSYRKHTGNTTTDWATQLYTHLGNGNNGNTLYFRTSNASTWQTWQMVAHADAGSAKGNSTKPIYINAKGEIQEGTALEDLAYIAKPTSNATTTFLRGDGTWQTALTAHQSLAAYATLASPALTGTPTAPTAANGTNTTQIATTAFVNNTLSYVNAMRFKGTLGTEGTITTLPASHEAGDTYRVITAGTWAGKYCEVGTLIICVKDGTVTADADWTSVETNEDGAVIGPANSTDNAIARFDGATGRIIQNSGISINDDGNLVIAHATSATMTAASTNPQIIFSESGTQPVHLIYSDYDSYRSPAGLKIIGGTSASPAWLEVEGNIYAAAFKGNADSATSANYINLYEARGTTTTLNKAANYIGAGKMFHLVASSNTSATDNGKTPTDANILQMNWDNSGGYDAQLGIATGANRMYFRSRPSQKIAWDEVAHAPVGTAGVGNATQPVYMTSEGVITAGTALKALAYKDSLTSSDIPDNAANTTGNAATATAIQTAGTTAQFYRGDNNWSSALTGSITISKAGECGLEVINSQATNPHKGFFGGGSSGNFGIYDRTYNKWIVYSDPNGNAVLNGNANTATKATQDESGNNIKATYAASFSISDHTITLKNKNGVSLGTVTVPDNNTATATDNILDGSNSGTQITYAPYTTQQSKLSFDTSSTNPTRTDRLNLNGYLYATKLYSGGNEVLTSHQSLDGYKTRQVKSKSLTTAGWYRILDCTAYSMAFFITFYGGYNNQPPTPVTFLVSHAYNTTKIEQIGRSANVGWIQQLRAVHHDTSKFYIDVYYAGNKGNTGAFEITPLDPNARSNITLIDFTVITDSITANASCETTLESHADIADNADTAISAGKWTTARTLTIGSAGKSVDGSGNVSWSLTEIGAAPAVTGGYLPLSGGTLTGAFTTANGTWNTMGDDAYFGDINKAGHIGIKGKNGNTGLFFTTYNQSSNTTGGAITWDGTKFSITSTTAVDASISGNAATATTATNLSTSPSLAANGNNITVTAGGKTSSAFTVPYASTAGNVAWANTNHPDTFPPTIGTTSTTAMAGNTTVTNVSYTAAAATDDHEYPILMKNSTGSTTTAAGVKFANVTNKAVTINPANGTITAQGGFYGSTFSGTANKANYLRCFELAENDDLNLIDSHVDEGILQNCWVGGGIAGSIQNRPDSYGVASFGMLAFKIATNWTGQILLSTNQAPGLYWRSNNNSSSPAYGAWARVWDSSNHRVFYGTCTEAAGTATKAVGCANYDGMKVGDIITVKFDNTNTAASPTLNVNGKGSKSVKMAYSGGTADLSSYTQLAGIRTFIYDGTNWILQEGECVKQGVTDTTSDIWRPVMLGAYNSTDVRQAPEQRYAMIHAARNVKYHQATGTLRAPILKTPKLLIEQSFEDKAYIEWNETDKSIDFIFIV